MDAQRALGTVAAARRQGAGAKAHRRAAARIRHVWTRSRKLLSIKHLGRLDVNAAAHLAVWVGSLVGAESEGFF
jgi:hypothetical protein